MQIHIHSEGRRLGPFTLEQINQSLQQGTLSASSAIAWYEGCPSWISLQAVPGIIISPGHSTPPPLPPSPKEGDATGGIIPYKNPCALSAYYIGIFGLFPVIGVLLAIPAIVLGIFGVKERKLNPIIKGSIHAWIGIILGVISLGYHAFLLILALSLP